MKVGSVILLNGTSSAGKTTLARALQHVLSEPFQHIALDQFRDGLPDRYRGMNAPDQTPGARGLNVVPVDVRGERVTAIQFGDVGESMLRGMRRAIAAFAREGNNVIVDDILFTPDYLGDYRDALDGIPVWFVAVRCALDVLDVRESSRPGRFPGTARAHFHTVHAHDVPYDVEVSTDTMDPEECAQAVAAALTRPPRGLVLATG